MDLNKVMLIGRLTRDPEIRSTASGRNVTSFSLATGFVWTDRNGQKQEKTEFHNVVAWGKLADICGQYLNKGRQIYIEGRLQTHDWVGQDGIKRYRTDVIADNMIMLGSKPAGATSFSPAPKTSAPAAAEETPAPAAASGEDEEEIKVEDIPF